MTLGGDLREDSTVLNVPGGQNDDMEHLDAPALKTYRASLML